MKKIMLIIMAIAFITININAQLIDTVQQEKYVPTFMESVDKFIKDGTKAKEHQDRFTNAKQLWRDLAATLKENNPELKDYSVWTAGLWARDEYAIEGRVKHNERMYNFYKNAVSKNFYPVSIEKLQEMDSIESFNIDLSEDGYMTVRLFLTKWYCITIIEKKKKVYLESFVHRTSLYEVRKRFHRH